MRRWHLSAVVLVLVIVALALASTPVSGDEMREEWNCTTDTNVTNPYNETVTVYVCESFKEGYEGWSYGGNNTIVVENTSVMPYVYIHELGHQAGLPHTENNTVMNPSGYEYVNDCRFSSEILDVVAHYETLELDTRPDYCQAIETPYGKLW